MKIIQSAIVVAAIVGTLSAASAQTTNVILQTDFDGDAGQGNYTGGYAYCVAGTDAGNPLPVSVNNLGVTAGVGVGGSSAYEASPNYTDLATDPGWANASAWDYAEVACGTDFGAPITAITPAPTLDSLILSADVQVSGLVPGQYGANVLVSKMQFLDINNNVIFDFNGYGGWASASGFTHISVPLSTLSYASDASNPVTDLTNAAVVGSIASFAVEFEVAQTVGVLGGTGANQLMPIYGFTSTGTLVVDNVELIQTVNTNTAPTPPTPTVEKVIWQANFDSTLPSGYDYGFSDRDGSPAATGSWAINPTGGVGGSASLEYTVNLSSWSSSPPISYSGFGVGANETPLPYALTSSSQASYRVYLSAKVGGTSAGVTNVPGAVDLTFFVPAGTLTPSNAAPAAVFDLNASLVLSTNWQTYEFDGTAMQVASYINGAQALFNQYVSQVNQMELQVTVQGGPDVGTLFGYDANNTVDIDNLKVVQLVPGLAPLMLIRTNSQSQIIWADPNPTIGGMAGLQCATGVSGPYLDITGAASAAASPYTVPPGNPQQFFRTVWIP
jgi:hypothetical protein